MSEPQKNPYRDFLAQFEDDIVSFVRVVFEVEPYPDQIEMLEAYQRGDRQIAKRSGHGPGKTTTLAWIINHHAVCRFPQKTVCTAPTSKQLFEALYAETVTWMKKLPPDLLQLFEIKSESIHLISAPEESFISFRTSSAEKPEALAGVHSAGFVLLIADEASGIPEIIFESASGSMSGRNATTILTGNPVRRSGLFFNVFTRPALMKLWTRFHVSSLGHPNVDRKYPLLIAAQYGENSNAYRVRVLGEFPLVDDDTVIPWELLEAALNRDVKPLLVRPIWGLDVARKGRDASALAKRKGNILEEPVRIWRGKDTMQTVGILKAEWDATLPSMRPTEINIDVIGIGAGVVDRARELGLPVRGINVSESAAMNERFRNLRSELWWKGKEWFEKRDSALNGTGWIWRPADNDNADLGGSWHRTHSPDDEWKDEVLAAELARPTYDYTPNGKIAVEGKKDTKKRTGEESPNEADAFLLTLASDAITAAGTDPMPGSHKEPIRREIKGIV